MIGLGTQSRWLLATVWLAAGCAGLFRSEAPFPAYSPTLPHYSLALTLGPRMEWAFKPLLVDLNGDGPSRSRRDGPARKELAPHLAG